jgi:hypothetical protein
VLTPAQEEVLALLRDGDRARPEVEASLREELRRTLEEELAPAARGLTAPVFVGKSTLGRVLACEAHHLDEVATPFEWNLAAARGTVAHKAIQLSVGRADRPAPLRLVDDALDRLADDPTARIADFLLGLTDADRAELRGDVNDVVAGFLELWPPLQPAWRPQAESPRRAELCGGMVVLSGKVDLTLGAPLGRQAGRVVIDLKTGGRHAGHVDDLRFYALLDTLRVGVPPFRLVSYYLDSGSLVPEEVTEPVLEAAVRRTVAATRKVIELELGLRSAQRTANVACRWCRLAETCDVRAAASSADGDDDYDGFTSATA